MSAWKKFLASMGIAINSQQFADNCSIGKPHLAKTKCLEVSGGSLNKEEQK
jgi:hypothetical protein